MGNKRTDKWSSTVLWNTVTYHVHTHTADLVKCREHVFIIRKTDNYQSE